MDLTSSDGHITETVHSVKLLLIPNLQYRSMVKSDPVIKSCASSNHTYQLPSKNFTYSTC